jgi:MoaA/NifB/PqqE/SkfB family radical SAM enzyme
MKNVYSLIKLNRLIKSAWIKNSGVYVLHATGSRYFALFLDPTLRCNLRCRMCYFSDETFRQTRQGRMLTEEEINKIANAFFHRALKLQIGCGAEPSLFLHNPTIIRLAKEKKVPYVSMTTNANLLKENDWKTLLEAGLDEVTLSLHGVKKETYEYFMTNASYEAFIASLNVLTDLKKIYPRFKIRVNYTVNKDNLEELSAFFEVFGNYQLDILQIRPIQNLGNTAYRDFSWDAIIQQYDHVIGKLRKEAAERGVTCIAPGIKDLTKQENENSSITDSTYFYISSRTCWESDFDLNTDTYESYSKRTHLGRKLFKRIFQKNTNKTKRKLNYEIE